MDKEQLKKFREHYFVGETIHESRSLMCKEFGFTERCARAWEQGTNPIQSWFVKSSNDYDKDGILRV